MSEATHSVYAFTYGIGIGHSPDRQEMACGYCERGDWGLREECIRGSGARGYLKEGVLFGMVN